MRGIIPGIAKWHKILTIDIETFSRIDLKACGLYRYCHDESFEIILFSYKYKGQSVKTIDLLSDEAIPEEVIQDILDPTVLKRAHNAQFERTGIAVHLHRLKDIRYPVLNPSSWQCTLVKCASIGLPRGLDHASKALRLTEEKDKSGKKLINLFCKPRKIPAPPKRKKVTEDYFRDRNYPHHYPAEWEQFKSYNAQDVIVEDAIDEELAFFKLPESEQKLWQLDQRINDRGVKIDVNLVKAAVEMHTDYKDSLIAEAADITGLRNPNSLSQLKAWLSEELDTEITKLDKDILPQLIKAVDDEKVRRVLKIRMETNKSSIDKYKAMDRAAIEDIIRGLLAFYGADTGRWSSKLVQLQNLLRNSDDFGSLEIARILIKEKNVKLINLLWGSVSYVLSQCVRTAFIPKPGHKLIASDFSQIESRMGAWMAGEKWKLKTFEDGLDIYKTGGANMFRMDYEEIIGEWRQKAKIGELACQYQGGEGAIARMWPKHLPLPSLQERKEIVSLWRQANKNIVNTWYDLQEAALDAVRFPGEEFSAGKCKYYMKKDYLFCELPSKRHIVYCRPRIVDGMYGDALECHTIGNNYQWQANSLYGGLLFENNVQGCSRDVLGEKMLALDDAGFDIIFHVHDENINDVPGHEAKRAAKRINDLMSEPLDWAPGLPLAAKTDILDFYKKD